MATIALTKENFTDVVSGAGLALIDFWASWCRPCRTFGPIFEQVSENHPDAVFGTVERARALDLDEVRRKRAARRETA